MNIDKVKAALTTANTELRKVVTEQATIISNPKSSVADITGASRALNVAGKIDAALARASASVEKSLTRLAPRAKKAKKEKADKK